MEGIRAVTTAGQEILLNGAVIAELRERLQGELLCAADSGYDEGRSIWNAMHDKAAGPARALCRRIRRHRCCQLRPGS